MITGNITCDSYEEAEFFNSVIQVGLLNMDNATKEKFKNSKIKIKCDYNKTETMNINTKKETK